MLDFFRLLLLAGATAAYSDGITSFVDFVNTRNSQAWSHSTNFTCYVGIYSTNTVKSYGSTVYCNGLCGSARSTVGDQNVTAFLCLDSSICTQLNVNGNCTSLPSDKDITACCCNDANNCNVALANLDTTITPPPVVNTTDPPIACYTGFWANGASVVDGGYQVCQGDCVSVTLNSTVNNVANSATIYTCDPSTYCRNYNILGNCSTIDTGMGGCCCNSDVCIDPIRGINPTAPLVCFAGVWVKEDNYTQGDDVACNGMCASVQTTVSGKTVKVYQCVRQDVCTNGLKIDGDGCTTFLSNNVNVTSCCCESGNNCNSANDNLNINIPMVNMTGTPIACWSGFYMDGIAQGTPGWTTCKGDCASFQWQTTNNGTTMTLFTCDPVQFINTLNASTHCGPIDNLSGLKVCSCQTSGCLDGSSNVPKTQAQLYCYVGLQTTAPNSSYGAQVACNGKCGSAIATLNGQNTTSFFCLDPTICNALSLNNACGPLPGDKDVIGCCCDNGNSCNIAQANVTLSSPPVNQTFTDPPIACFTGIDVDGQLLSSTYQSCLGDCVSIRLETKVNGANHSATLYTCDPSTYCRNYGILGNCSTIEDGMTGCCCSTDVCIDPTRNKFPGRKLTCYVGIQTDFPNKTTGQTVYCDGKCGSATTVLQDDSGKNYSTTSFFCLDNSVCSALGLDNQCQPMPGDKEVMGCCCDNMDNCNIGQAAMFMPTPVTSVPNVTDSTDPKIACYAGVWINGNALMPGKFMSCQGDCASITLNTKVYGTNHTATLYTCDPSTFCRSVGILGGCSQIEPRMTGCCCNTDSCIDPTRNKVPVSNLTCYVGLQTGFPGKTYGSTVPCSGKCGSATAVLAGYPTTTFFCLDSTICSNLQLDNSCSGLPGDKDVTGCCCDNDYNCNVKQANMTFSPPAVTNNTDPRIACYAGVWLDGAPVNGGGTFTACQGDCVSITLNTNVSNVPHSATLYTCDPSYYCTQFNMTNSCNSIEPGMDGCCCNTDSCIDPTRNKTPRDPLTCYVGVQSDLPGKSSGSTVFCNGKCGSAITTLQDTNGKNYNTTSFFCMDNSVCKTLALDNACLPLPGDKDVMGCCCDNGAACNVAQAAPFMSNPVTSVPNATVSTDPRIACYAGVWVDGQPVQDGVFTACQGDCVSITLNSKVNGANHTATLYTCDPSTFCRSFDILGKCSQIEPGMTGCCCNTDSCIDPTRNKSPARGLTCYVGLQTDFPDKTYGSTVPCDGKCASAQAILAGYKTTTFFCLDSGTCSTLGLDNSCGGMPGDKDITGCCCDNDYNCNIAQANFGGVITAPPVVNNTDPRIACYSGVWVNGAPLGPGTYQACQGNCVSITLNTTVDKTPHYATLFTCDPSYYCRQFGMANQCANIEPGMKGCCCDSDSCIDPTRNRSPDNPLTCYVGIQTDFANKTYGSTVYCSGKCGSASTTLASYNISYNITTFFCFQDNGICSALGLDNSCAGMPGDKEVTGCCCDNNPNCNIAQAGFDGKIIAPVVVPYDDPMIACYSGVWVNGQPLANGTYLPCQGDCVSITLNTSVNNNNHTASIYTCDPSSYCKRFDILGKCSPIEPGMDGCCCNTDVCIDPTKNRSPNNPLVCFAGVYVKEDNYTLGQDVNCDGKCISIQTMVSSKTVKVYQCAARTVCTDGLGIDDNGCTTFKEAGTDVSACCCDDSTNCNTKNDNLTYVIPSANWTSIPIACLSGFFKNGKAQGTPTWSTCFGYCVSFQWKYSNSSDTMTLYTCDPVQFVQNLNVDNKCSSVDNMEGLKVCSCNSQGCLTGDSNIPNDIQTTTPSPASRSDLWFLVSLSLLTIFLRQ